MSVDTPVLQPPDRKLQTVTVNYDVTDNCTAQPHATLSVSSNQPISGPGTGNFGLDWVIVDAHHVQLRAELTAKTGDRIYTILVTGVDDSGNSSSASVKVTVPRNQTGPPAK